MTGKEIFFCCILLANAVVSVLYLVAGLLYVRQCEAEDAKGGVPQEQDGGTEKNGAGNKRKPKKAAKEDKQQGKTVKEEDKQQGETVKDKNRKQGETVKEKDRQVGADKEDAEQDGQEEELPMRNGRIVYVMNFAVMMLCPVAGPIFFGAGYLLYRFVFRQDVQLEDVIFSKERVKTNERADEERERNIAPLEEAIAVSDKESLRSLMLNVIRGDVHNSLAAISLALNSPDSETAHYAASVLQDELNNFRGNVQKIWREIEKEEEGQTDCEYYLIPYMNNMLEQKVFTEMEQRNMVNKFAEVGEVLFRKAQHRFTSQYYEWLCLRLLDIKDFEAMETWCSRGAAQYPEELSSYTCKLKLYFTAGNKEKFFETMNELKHSSIVIDKETLALIRTFS